MNLTTKLAVLDQIYRIYDEFSGKLNVACHRYCAECCTRNVTLTTLEAYKIADSLISKGKSDLFGILEQQSDKKRFQPKTTTNRLAEICMRGEEPPDEENDASWGACPFLTNKECPIYAVRPFGCRCLVSKQDCSQTGYADTDPFVFAVNQVFLQFIEHVDAQGFSGNFTDMLLFMASDDKRKSYKNGKLAHSDSKLIPNAPIKILMVFPEHKAGIMPILQALQSINVPRDQADWV
jgi:Fe-S-cluster containining protein